MRERASFVAVTLHRCSVTHFSVSEIVGDTIARQETLGFTSIETIKAL